MKLYQLIANGSSAITLAVSEDRSTIDRYIGQAVGRLNWYCDDLKVVTWENGEMVPSDEHWSLLSK